MLDDIKVFVKTPLGIESVCAARISETTECKAIPRPEGMQGIVLVKCDKDPEDLAKIIEKEIAEAEKVLPVFSVAKADLNDICKEVKKLATKYLSKNDTFAVRTTRRGVHEFTSIDVNVRAGACIQEVVENQVDLSYPDKVFWIEIIKDRAFISVTSEKIFRKKYPGKPDAYRFLKKIVVAQMPYLGDPRGAYKVGERLGRIIQTFEINEFYITPHVPTDASEFFPFLRGILEGIESRYKIQKRTYARKVDLVPVKIYDLYQFVRMVKGKEEPIIVTSTKGVYIGEVVEELVNLFKKSRKVNVLIGSREGIPAGVFRFADLIIDVMPGITLATDVATSSIITAITNLLVETTF